MTGRMHRTALAGLLFVALLSACPSKGGEQKDANAGGATPPPPSSPAAPATGPLAELESSPFMNEVWTVQGQPVAVLFYTRENVRLSGQCRSAAGQLDCAALRQLRGAPVEIPKSELDGRTSAGVKACSKLGVPVVIAVSQNGDEESFCRFADGSLVSAGTLERYGIRPL